jgi:hypothetical protein
MQFQYNLLFIIQVLKYSLLINIVSNATIYCLLCSKRSASEKSTKSTAKTIIGTQSHHGIILVDVSNTFRNALRAPAFLQCFV